MIRLLKRLADWLDKRFPSRVVITEAKFSELEDRLRRCIQSTSDLNVDTNVLADRILVLEKSIAAMKETLVKGGANVLKPEADKLRDAFVRGEFNRGPSRAAVEAG